MSITESKYKRMRNLGTVDNWLYSRGDRSDSDLKKDSMGLYVLMWNGEDGEPYKVYLPKNLK